MSKFQKGDRVNCKEFSGLVTRVMKDNVDFVSMKGETLFGSSFQFDPEISPIDRVPPIFGERLLLDGSEPVFYVGIEFDGRCCVRSDVRPAIRKILRVLAHDLRRPHQARKVMMQAYSKAGAIFAIEVGAVKPPEGVLFGEPFEVKG